MLDVRLFRGIDCDINHCLVVAKVMKKLLGSTRETEVWYGQIKSEKDK
jgi:hypothetical protein